MENKFFIKNSLYIESPNFDDRPKDIETDTIIIHSIKHFLRWNMIMIMLVYYSKIN